MTPTTIFTFGKYKGKTVEDVINTDPAYVAWADRNVAGFRLTDEQSRTLQQSRNHLDTYRAYLNALLHIPRR